MRSHKGPLPDETCLGFGKKVFEALKFLHEEVGMAHNDIHGNCFHQNHLRLEVIITIPIKYYFLLLLLLLLLILLLLLAAIHRPYPNISAFKLFFCSYSK